VKAAVIDQGEIDRVVARIAASYAPDVIALFGSYATGLATERSDLDLLVIKRTSEPRHRRVYQVRRLLSTMYKVDVVVLTPEEVEGADDAQDSFVRTIVQQMKILYVGSLPHRAMAQALR
jgi:predicted nucleotidyltransferase